MNEGSENTTTKVTLKGSILLVMAAVFGVAAVYFGLIWGQLATAQGRGSELEKQASESAVTLGAAIKTLRENPQSAPNIAPELGKLKATLDQLTLNVDQLNAGMLPTGATVRNEYQEAIRFYVSGIRDHASRLETITALVADRTETVRKVSEGFQQLDKLSDPGITEKALQDTLEDVKSAVDSSIDGLRSIAMSASTVYSSDALIARLSAISGAIGEVVGGLKDRDQQRLDRAAQSFTQLMQDDWESIYLEYDAQGIAQLASSMKRLSDRHERVSDTRERFASAQKSMGLLSLAALIGAVVFAVLARRQRVSPPRGRDYRT